jgi:hypothetical protein
MKRILTILLFGTAAWFAGCTKESPTAVTQDLVVVRAYLYAGKAVDQIHLSQVLALGSEDTTMAPINDAQVSLIRQGIETPLALTLGDSGYYHDESGLAVQAGDDFKIRILYKDQTVEGETTVPQAPENLAISSTTLAVSDTIGRFGGGFGAADSSETLTATWTAESGALYYEVLEVTGTDTAVIDTFRRGGGDMMRRTISSPSASGEYRIRRSELSYYGTYRLTVYRVNQEYADLYETRQQDSRDLNEPRTNIQNGLGVFSAFNSVEVTFKVVRASD